MSRILFVDDDPHLLEGLERLFGLDFDIATAGGGAEGLALLAANPECQIVVSDMRMPGMDGAAFLAEVRRLYPETIRILLTGQADIESSIAAVNQGQIFRFLTKPCEHDVLDSILRESLEIYRLRHVEQDLLQRTLRAVVDMLSHVLGMASPVAFGRATRMAEYVNQLSAELDPELGWQFEVAAHLSHLGCVALSPETVARAHALQPMDPEEIREYKSHTEITSELLAPIPRLATIAEIVRQHQFEEAHLRESAAGGGDITLGAQALRLALEIDRRVVSGIPLREATALVRSAFPWVDPRLAITLPRLTEGVVESNRLLAVHPKDLTPGMQLDEEIRTRSGMLLVPARQAVTPAIIRLVQSFASHGQVEGLIRVQIAA